MILPVGNLRMEEEMKKSLTVLITCLMAFLFI